MNANIINFDVPSKIIFGIGAYNQILSEVEDLNANKILILSSKSARLGLEEELTLKGKETMNFSNFKGEPNIETINQCLKFTEGFNPDLIIGIGGGSVLDTAKFVALIKGNNYTKIENFTNIEFYKDSINTIMVPTTSGTGSEATPNAIFMDSDKNKCAVVSRQMIPNVAIIDPELMLTIPPNITALTGIDALSHCVESFLSINGSQWSDEIAMKGIKLVYKSLNVAIKNGEDLDARYNMALASFLGGVALTNAGTCSVHALAYPLAKYGLSHSMGIAILLPYVLLHHGTLKVEKIEDLKTSMNISQMKDLVDPIINALRIANCPYNLKDANIPEEDIEMLIKEASMQERLLKNNPINLKEDDIKTIYKMAFSEY